MESAQSSFQEAIQELTRSLTQNLCQAMTQTLEERLNQALTQSLLESEFYRKISGDMRDGLRKIYREVNVAQSAAAAQGAAQGVAQGVADSGQGHRLEQPDKLLHDASEQLSAVLRQTEDAANTIMELVEKRMVLQEESAKLLELAGKGRITPDGWQRLQDLNASLNDDLNALISAMSFQDLTGQRIKKAVTAIRQLEATVLELYVSSGLMIKAYAEEPGLDMSSIEQKTKAQVADITKKVVDSELKGPAEHADQGDIDALLAQFGL